MTVVIGILALIGLAVVGAIGWAFAQGVRDGLAAWREVPPGGTSQSVPVGEPPLSLSAALPSSYQVGQLAGEVAASWQSANRAAGAPGIPASSSWAAALALGSELSQQRQKPAGPCRQPWPRCCRTTSRQCEKQRRLPLPTELTVPTVVTTVTAHLLVRCRTDRTVTATVVSRRLVRPVLPGRLTRPHVARRGRVPGGARSSDRLGRMSGSREHLAPFSIHMLRHFARVLQKPQHRLSWPLNGACVHFVSWGGTTETAHKRRMSRRLVIVNPEALQHASVRGMYGIRATCCRCAK